MAPTAAPADPLPSDAALAQAAALLVVGANGESRTFASLCDADEDGGAERTLIIFIRHFYCGDCQEYVPRSPPLQNQS